MRRFSPVAPVHRMVVAVPRPREVLGGVALLAAVLVAVLMTLILAPSSSQATHTTPPPTMAVDAEVSDNGFALLNRNDNHLNVTDIDQCVGVINPDPAVGATEVQVDVVLNNAPDVLYSDIRFNLKDQAGNLLPNAVAEVAAMTASVAVDGSNPVGFINLPVLRNGTLTTPAGNTRRGSFESPVLNDADGFPTAGTNYLALTNFGPGTFFMSADSTHPGQARTSTTLATAAVAGDAAISLTNAGGFAVNNIIEIGNTAAAAEEKKITSIVGNNVDLSSGLDAGFAAGVTVQKGEPYQVTGAGALLARVTILVHPPAADSVIVLDLSTSEIAPGVNAPGTTVGLGITNPNGEMQKFGGETNTLSEAQLTDAFIFVNPTGAVGACPETTPTPTPTATSTPTPCAPEGCPTSTPTGTATATPTRTATATPTPAPKTIRVPADRPTIQAGIDSASNGDTVLVSPGTYHENINFRGKAIRVISERGAKATVIDGDRRGSVVIFDSREGLGSVLTGFTVRNGLNYSGAGIALVGTSPTITDNMLVSNTALVGGSGAGIEGGDSSPLIERNIFLDHSCDDQSLTGVLTFYNASSPRILNNIIANNRCRGINMELPAGGNAPRVLNNTIIGNFVGIRAGSWGDTALQIYANNILVHNEIGFQVQFRAGSQLPTLRNNLVFANSLNYSGPNQTGQNGNISADPFFADMCHLQLGSPAIDAGDNGVPGLPAKDFNGNDRILDGNGDGQAVVDIGPAEFTPSSPPPVNPVCPAMPPPKTIRVPSDQPTIQQAIDTANERDTVLVSPGTYLERIDYRGKDVTVRSVRGADATIIDAQATGTVVKIVRGEGPDGALEGFTVRGGSVSGIAISESSPVLRNNKIVDNTGCEGAGINISFASPIVQGNLISRNNNAGCTTGIGGGGVFIGGNGRAQILDNVITENVMAYYCCQRGGGISLWAAGTPTITGNVISRNRANTYGGGIDLVNHSDALIAQNLITENQAGLGGGISWTVPYGSRGPLVVNNTIAYNTSSQDSGILADGWDAQTLLVNNIVLSNSALPAILCGSHNDGPPLFEFNDVFNSSGPAYGALCNDPTGVNGNISADPVFVDNASGVCHLQPGSPAIDAGDNSAPDLPATDFDGDPRVLDGNGDGSAVVDMGVDEFSLDDDNDNACPPQPRHDANARNITGLGRITGSPATTKTVKVKVKNQGDHIETIGVYVDITPPGGISNPYGCAPTGRVIETTVALASDTTSTVSSTPQSFSCANVAGARGKSYTVVFVADAHAGDQASCGPGTLQTMACFNALADDDDDDGDNRKIKTRPRVHEHP